AGVFSPTTRPAMAPPKGSVPPPEVKARAFAIAAAARARRSVRDIRLAPPSKSTERTMVLLEVDVAKYKARLADIERASVQPNADPADALDLAISCLTEIIS